MPILNKAQIESLIKQATLIHDPLRNSGEAPIVEAASYDLRAGIVLWKDNSSSELRTEYFDEGKAHQAVVTLQPGQMVFVITHEELELPASVSGTVYSRNKLQKKNVVALNAGHVDPGYYGPILIRLINLGAQQWPLQLGEQVFTVVFHTVEPVASPQILRRTKQETIEAASETATQAFSNPFHDLYKAEIKRQLDEYYAQAENNIRNALEKHFFPRSQVHQYLFYAAASIIAGVFLLSRIPWDRIWAFVKIILNF